MTDVQPSLNLSGYTPLPRGKIASVVTSLEMAAPFPSAPPEGGAAVLRRVPRPSIAWYRDLYRRIGEPWLWFSRLEMSDGDLEQIVQDDAVEIYAIDEPERRDVGLVELDLRQAGECELAFFGVVPGALGLGLGRAAMGETLRAVARPGLRRLWVHTCTLDHPAALRFYERSGFVPFARSIEVVDDPRLRGVLPRTSAPHVPVIE